MHTHSLILAIIMGCTLTTLSTGCTNLPFIPSKEDRLHDAEYDFKKLHGRTPLHRIHACPPAWLAKEDWPQFFACIDSVCDIMAQEAECARDFPFGEIKVWCHENLGWCAGPYGFPKKIVGGQTGRLVIITWRPEKDAVEKTTITAPASTNSLEVLAHEIFHCVFLMKKMYNPYSSVDVHETLFKQPEIIKAVAATKARMKPIKLSEASLTAWRAYRYTPWRE